MPLRYLQANVMAFLEISILLMAFVHLGISLTNITTSQTTTPLAVTSTLQVTVQAGSTTLGTATSHATSSQISTMSQATTISRDATTSPSTKTSQSTRTSPSTQTSQSAKTSQATTPPATTSPSATTSTRSPVSTVSATTSTRSPVSTVSATTSTRSPFSTVSSTFSTRSPVSTVSDVPSSYKPDPGNYDLRLLFDLKLMFEYKKAYEDKTSPEFQSLATNISVSLTEHYQNIQGFKSIEIIRFSPGSIIVEYYVNVYATLDIPAVTNQIGNDAVDSLTSVSGVPVDINYTRTSMRNKLASLRIRDKCSLASANVCSFGYYCKPASTATILCIDRCSVSVCENNGLCYIGHLSDDVQCKCPVSDGVTFSGEHCEIKLLVMTEQQRNLYLIIVGSIVGAIIFSFVLTVCIINRKGKHLRKKLSNVNRMEHDATRTTDIEYIRDINNRCVECNHKAINREQQHKFDASCLPYQGGVNEDANDGYVRAVRGVQPREEHIYDYVM